MSEVNQQTWEKMIDEDIEWLEELSPDDPSVKPGLELRHIISCLKWLRSHKPETRDQKGCD